MPQLNPSIPSPLDSIPRLPSTSTEHLTTVLALIPLMSKQMTHMLRTRLLATLLTRRMSVLYTKVEELDTNIAVGTTLLDRSHSDDGGEKEGKEGGEMHAS